MANDIIKSPGKMNSIYETPSSWFILDPKDAPNTVMNRDVSSNGPKIVWRLMLQNRDISRRKIVIIGKY